jgi:hypothetical protein
MSQFTLYLATVATSVNEYSVQISDTSPVDLAQAAIRASSEVKYSPIMPAYLSPRPEPNPHLVPADFKSVTLVFSSCPYRTLGVIRPLLREDELRRVYFTLGLASIAFIDFPMDRVVQLGELINTFPLEHWPVENGKVNVVNIIAKFGPKSESSGKDPLLVPTSAHPELRVYTEQISASMQSLWANYEIYFPEERETLRQIAAQARTLIQHYSDLQNVSNKAGGELENQKKLNAIRGGLVEIGGWLQPDTLCNLSNQAVGEITFSATLVSRNFRPCSNQWIYLILAKRRMPRFLRDASLPGRR